MSTANRAPSPDLREVRRGSTEEVSPRAASPLVSVVIGSYNRLDYLRKAVAALRSELEDVPHETIVVDGGSVDGTLRWLTRQEDVITIVQHNRTDEQGRKARRSWGYFMNLGFKCAQGRYLCMLSDDTIVVPGAIRNGIETLESAAANGARPAAAAFYWQGYPCRREKRDRFWIYRVFDQIYVNHGLFLREAVEQVGFCDEEYSFYWGDVDLCLKLIDRGYSTIDAPSSYVIHRDAVNVRIRTSNRERLERDWRRLLQKWQGRFHDLPLETSPSSSKDYRDFHDATETWKRFRSLSHRLFDALEALTSRLPSLKRLPLLRRLSEPVIRALLR